MTGDEARTADRRRSARSEAQADVVRTRPTGEELARQYRVEERGVVRPIIEAFRLAVADVVRLREKVELLDEEVESERYRTQRLITEAVEASGFDWPGGVTVVGAITALREENAKLRRMIEDFLGADWDRIRQALAALDAEEGGEG